MALVFADRVRDTTTTTGTGTKTVSGTAPLRYRTFSTVCSLNDTFPGFIANQSANEWECGLYQYTGTNQITAVTVSSSSNAGSAVNFSGPTMDVVLSPTAELMGVGKIQLGNGALFTPFSIGTVSSGTTTPDPNNANYQYYTNNGAHTLAAPSTDCAIDILITNGASAGAITFSGFTVGSNTGDALTTTNTNKFLISIRRINAVALYSITALQ